MKKKKQWESSKCDYPRVTKWCINLFSLSENACVRFTGSSTVEMVGGQNMITGNKYNYDHVFQPDCSQLFIFERAVKPIV